jgi:hypothetical protein
MGQLKIKRVNEWANRRFTFRVIVDGKEEFEIANGQERILNIDKPVTIQAKIMWGGSQKIHINMDNDSENEIWISSNKEANIRLPIVAISVIFICALVNLIFPENVSKDFMNGLLAGVIIPLIGLLIIRRNNFIDIELVTS